ncbi:unnamed protein product [Alopecurus aequalis]
MAHPPLANGKKTKGRQSIEIRRVENKASRQVTFSKRKTGVWKKAAEIAVLCGARVAVVVFSEAGKAYAFGSPSVEAVLGCGGDVPYLEDLEALGRETEEKRAEVKVEVKRMSDVGTKVLELKRQTGKSSWWEVDPAALEAAELPVFIRALQRLRDNVGRRVDKLPPTPPPLLITGS